MDHHQIRNAMIAYAQGLRTSAGPGYNEFMDEFKGMSLDDKVMTLRGVQPLFKCIQSDDWEQLRDLPDHVLAGGFDVFRVALPSLISEMVDEYLKDHIRRN